ncbi:unnamed protein product [Ascophyllum nodosum]
MDEAPRIDLAKIEEFERNRYGYFADDFSKTALYWSSLCDTMHTNDGSTEQVLAYIASKMETDRVYSASVYAHADKVFGDKKGTAKLRHDKIRHAEQKAKLKGDKPPDMEDSHVAGGAGRESRPTNSTVNVIWEMAERDCRAARYRDVLCDDLEAEDMLGKVKNMNATCHKRLGEYVAEGEACLVSLKNIDLRVGRAFVKLREVVGGQLGGHKLSDDVWFLNTRYHTAVVHQKEAWFEVEAKLRDVFIKLKALEATRRAVLREFLIGVNEAIIDSWSMLPKLCGAAAEYAAAVDASGAAVDADVNARMSSGVEEKKMMGTRDFELENVTKMSRTYPPPSDMTFIDRLTAPLESPLIRKLMMIERREGRAIGSKYYTGLMVLTWQGFLHFFDIPEYSKLKKDVSPVAALQDISPTISLDDLLANRRDLEEVLMFKSTQTLQLDAESTVTEPSSKKSQHKIEVKGKAEQTSIKRHFGSATTSKTVTFRTTSEAEMNHAMELIKESIQDQGGMTEEHPLGQPYGHPYSSSGRSSFGSVRSDTSAKEVDPEPTPLPTPAPAEPAEESEPAGKEKAPATKEEEAPAEPADAAKNDVAKPA